MNLPRQGRRIVWLLRTLTAIGLAMVVTTLGLVGWTLTRVRSERARATAEQDRLDEASQSVRDRAADSRMEIQIALDETATRTNGPSAVENFKELIDSQLNAGPEPAVRTSLNQLRALASRLGEIAGRANTWRANYGPIWEDLRRQRTMGQVRSLIAQLRAAVETFEGRRRLSEAIKYRRWRNAGGEEASRQAGAILLEQGRQQSRESSDFKNQLAEFARLAELLGGEEQFDSLADLKDNKLKPVLDRLSRSIAAFGTAQTEADALQPQSIENFRVALFGEGYVSDEAHQNIQAGRGGLFTLRWNALQLRREREKLKNELAALSQKIEAANASFAQSTQVRTAALAQQMERSLESGWRQMLIFGGACSALFLWLAWVISRGINGQVSALELARAEAEIGRETTQKLMLEQQAAAAELATAHLELQASEQRFRTLSASAPIGIYLTDAAGCSLYTNPHYQRITGLSMEESLGDGWKRAVHPDDAGFVFSARDISTNEGREFDSEFRFRRPDGEARWVQARTTNICSETGEIIGRVGTLEDITERKRAEAELQKIQKELIETSRLAGMAEVATGVLHNVGNVLNSVNVSVTLLADCVKKSKTASLNRIVALLREHAADLGTFLVNDPKGRLLPGYLEQLAEHVAGEQAAQLKELGHLQKNVQHIKEIVTMQQTYAKVSGVTEIVPVGDLLEDALRMNEGALNRHQVEVVREFRETPAITIEKHKVLQILVNLVSNAKYACTNSGRADKRLTLRVVDGDGRVRISVIDNGVGIAAENLTRIFQHGFTTKKGGHGFGLHSGALAAMELGGALTVQSEGPGRGATFILELPIAPVQRNNPCNPLIGTKTAVSW